MVRCDNLPRSMCVVTENVLEIKAFCRQDSTLWRQDSTFCRQDSTLFQNKLYIL